MPMNTKYLSGNPISRWFIRNFLGTATSLITVPGRNQVKTILDVGCGEGLILRQLVHLRSWDYCYGLDVAPQLIDVARKLAPGVSFAVGSVLDLPFADAEFDLILCTEVLEHLESPRLAASEIGRVGNRFFLISVPNEPWWRIANVIRGAYLRDCGNPPGHLNHWTCAEFVLFLSEFFEILAVRRPFPWTIVLCQKK